MTAKGHHRDKTLVVVGGPTAAGKTSVAIRLAKHYKTEILSADSRQFYREMSIGTAKPDAEELTGAKHHFIDSLSIHDPYNAGDYEREALSLLDTLFAKHDVAILVGGSGLFIKAVCDGLDEMPEVDPRIRQELNSIFEQEGIVPLQKMLRSADPVYFEKVDQQNHVRLIRALEVIKGTGRPFSGYHSQQVVKRPFGIVRIALAIDRDELYQRIDDRMDTMIDRGLFDEARLLLPFAHFNALQTVGYQEIFGYLNGEYDKEEAVRLMKRNSRRYAKRQLTWFHRVDQFTWFDPLQLDEMIELINSQRSRG